MLNRRFLLTAGASALLLPSTVLAAVQKVVPGAQGLLNIRDFGAKGDGKTIDSPAIDKAIAEAAKRGGGTVFFPAGTYASYTVHLQSRVTLYLDQGAVLLAAPVPLEGTTTGGYDLAEPQNPAFEAFQDYGHNHWKNSLIYGEGLHDIAIVGDGMIWGKGLSRGLGRDKDLPKSDLPGVGNKAIALKNCFNVQLRDFKLLQGGWFALLATGVDNLVIDNLTVDTNRDGFDIDCCKNVRVSNCTVNSPFDDGICPKSSFALGYARPTENVTITNCYLSGRYEVGSVIDGSFKRMPPEFNGTGRIKCGTESNGGLKNITVSNCVFDESRGIALETVDGALLEDIAITNITMRGAQNSPLFLRLGRRMRGPKDAAVGVLKRVMISNVTSSSGSLMPSIIAGVEGHPVEDVKISDIYLEQVGGAPAAMAALMPKPAEDAYPEPKSFGDLPATGFFIQHVRNLEMAHVEIAVKTADPRAAFWMQDVDGFDISTLRVPSAPVFNLNGVKGFRSWGHAGLPDRRFDALTTGSY
jgi:polygalacturonase